MVVLRFCSFLVFSSCFLFSYIIFSYKLWEEMIGAYVDMWREDCFFGFVCKCEEDSKNKGCGKENLLGCRSLPFAKKEEQLEDRKIYGRGGRHMHLAAMTGNNSCRNADVYVHINTYTYGKDEQRVVFCSFAVVLIIIVVATIFCRFFPFHLLYAFFFTFSCTA